jgi:hypothetical protein
MVCCVFKVAVDIDISCGIASTRTRWAPVADRQNAHLRGRVSRIGADVALTQRLAHVQTESRCTVIHKSIAKKNE